MRRLFFILMRVLLYIFAAIGLAFVAVFIAMRFGLLNVRGSILERNSFFGTATTTTPCVQSGETVCEWNTTPEWQTVAGGLQKDAAVIGQVSGETGVSARLIATVVVPEQLRFFTSEREIFKSYFEPLKILGSLSQFSLGVSGIKQETANDIEKYAADPASPFYPGAGAASLLAYLPEEGAHDTALYNRLTDPKNHYYSYLYTALYIKEVEAEWQNAGFDIAESPGIIATLFNIGFQNSHPNGAPQVGGAPIDIGGKTYTFGELGAHFYASNELRDVFSK